ncbi:MAG: hypothetical protein LBU58_08400, partial [Clostridiales bacterium]|nr:hypothetical protein [Clostridiales bacterium]
MEKSIEKGGAGLWWRRRQRVIQTNLQVRDTEKIDPERLVGQIQELGGTTLVFNVGGIYAWYPSEIPYHHVNEYLPRGRDLLAEVVGSCHERGIRFVGRFDFSKADDRAYQAHPEWFAYDADGKPYIVGATRPGEWSLLYTTCINSGYWNDQVAFPALTEALRRYEMDAVFLNAPFPSRCHCEVCERLYFDAYGLGLPTDGADAAPSWRTRQMEWNLTEMKRRMEAARPGTPLILYHWPEQSDYLSEQIGEMVCSESQNVLSRGLGRLSDNWEPNMTAKLCALDSPLAPPYGIIHSSPGMDWRHTGLPPAEYRMWLSQVPAAGASLWHSVTGVPDTISDGRLLESVRSLNEKIKAQEDAMEGTDPVADIGLLYDRGAPPKGWLRALHDRQYLFGLLVGDAAADGLENYPMVLLPEGYPVTDALAAALEAYVRRGGALLTEGKLAPYDALFAMSGIRSGQKAGESLSAAYIRTDAAAWKELKDVGLSDTPLIGFRGKVWVAAKGGAVPGGGAANTCESGPAANGAPDSAANTAALAPTAPAVSAAATTLATLVPSFAPLDAVGAPPERASLPTPYTDIPLILEQVYGKGRVLTLTFSLDSLIRSFGLGEHVLLASALLDRCLPAKSLEIRHYPGLIANLHA